jgi:peptidyl-prolyl cis-trans isomerase B (cyclophilin B)
VFGKVVAGQDVVDRIKGVATASSGMHQNVPKDDVVLVRAEETAA